jgi:hypothetical protein
MDEYPPVALEILRSVTDYRRRNYRNFDGVVLISVFDARKIDEQQQQDRRKSEEIDRQSRQALGLPLPPVKSLFVESKIKVGDSATIWGLKCIVEDLAPGTAVLWPRLDIDV